MLVIAAQAGDARSSLVAMLTRANKRLGCLLHFRRSSSLMGVLFCGVIFLILDLDRPALLKLANSR
jgi:hypothetical protein